MWKKSMVNHVAIMIFAVIFGLSLLTDIPLYLLVIASGIAGVLFNKKGRKQP